MQNITIQDIAIIIIAVQNITMENIAMQNGEWWKFTAVLHIGSYSSSKWVTLGGFLSLLHVQYIPTCNTVGITSFSAA